MIHVIEQIVRTPDFQVKMSHMFPRAARANLGATLGMTGNTRVDLARTAGNLAKVAYLQRRERSLINSGLQALQEIENGH